MTPRLRLAATIAIVVAIVLFFGAFLVRERTADLPSLSSLSLLTGGEVEGALPAGTQLPEPRGIAGWFNTPGNAPLTAPDLRGKIVLVDFWTYSCINCIRTLPYLVDWHAAYADSGLVILGIHTPEFAFEKNPDNVRRAIDKYGIRYPVALDNDYATWNAFGNRYWPAKYLFDAEGRLVYTHFGEGRYEETEAKIRALLTEAGAVLAMPMTTEESGGPDFSRLGSPETYLGFDRGTRFGNNQIFPDAPHAYVAPTSPALNRAYFGGTWTVENERAVLVEAGGTLTYRFRAAQVHLVMGAPTPVRMRVRLNGTLIGEDFVRDKDVYTLVTQTGYEEGVIEIEFLDPGVEVYAFTFG